MKIKIGILITILSLMLVGCSSEESIKPEDNTPNGNESQENIDNEEDKDDEQDDVKDDEQNNEIKENEEENNNTEQENTSEEEAKENFTIYTLDVNDTDKKIGFKDIELDKDDTVEEKFKELCVALEKEYFKDENAKIVFKSIDENNIATIDLVNKDAWSQHFQGSTGGMISQGTIVETLLQRDYAGEWIDGLNVVVDGSNEEELFEHAPFIEIFYRNK